MFRRIGLLFLLAAYHTISLYSVGCSDVSCRAEYLLSVTNKTEGLEIALFSKDDHSTMTGRKVYEFLTLPLHYTSPECGGQSFRCNEITTYVAKETSRHIAMVPLLNALLVLDIDIRTMQFHSNVTLSTEKCSPITVFAILESFYTVCIDSSMGKVYLYEVRVNSVHLKNSHLTTALAEIALEDQIQLSNFVYASLGRQSDDQRVYFTASNSIYALIPLSGSYSYIGSIDNCNSVHNLAYVGDWILLSYCSDGSLVYFDLQDEAVSHVETTATDGEPYHCPNSNVDLRLYRDSNTEDVYIEFTSEEKQVKQSYKLPGSNYHSGVCFSVENSTYLAYIDSEEGVFVFELEAHEFRRLSPNPCPASGCLPLLIINNTYIVIREESSVSVIYREGNNFSQVITAPHLNAKLLTVIAWQYQCSDTSSNSTVPPNMKQNSNTTEVVIIVIAMIILVVTIIVFAFIIIILVVRFMPRKRQNISRIPVQVENGGSRELVIANITAPSPLLVRTDHVPVDEHNPESSTTTTIPEKALQIEKHHPVSLSMKAKHESNTECTGTPVTSTSGRSEIEPGMDTIKTTIV